MNILYGWIYDIQFPQIFLGSPGACTCNVYQALFSPPLKKGPGYEASYTHTTLFMYSFGTAIPTSSTYFNFFFQKSGLIIFLVLFHSTCPYKNYCLKCFTELQTLFIYLFNFFFYLVCNYIKNSEITQSR